jgi:hypothetical protein
LLGLYCLTYAFLPEANKTKAAPKSYTLVRFSTIETAADCARDFSFQPGRQQLPKVNAETKAQRRQHVSSKLRPLRALETEQNHHDMQVEHLSLF